MNVVDTHNALLKLYAAFPHTEWSEETMTVYVDHLIDIPVEELKPILSQAIATCKFPPTIAEIRDTWHSLHNVNRLTWADGWNAVQKEIRRIGSYSTPKFDDPITAKVVEAMGWKTLCAAPAENIATDRAQFRQMYESYASRQETAQKLLPQARELVARSNGGLVSIRELLEVKHG